MAKVYGPAMSFDARGKLANSIVFSDWKGIGYARKYTIPKNPRTTAQVTQRGLFSWVHDVFKWLPTDVSQSWYAYAQGKPLSGPNVWSQKNIKALYGQANNDAMIFIPAVLGGPALTNFVVTPGASQLVVTADDPVLPTGWSATKFIGICTPQITSFVETEPVLVFSAEGAVSPWTATITGLTTGTTYVVGGGFIYTRSDGKTAYNGAVSTTGVPT